MAAWLVSALQLLARGGGTSLVKRGVAALGTGAAFAGGSQLFGSFVDGDAGVLEEGKPRRRRRRRALTASDRADIAFIQATLGQAAGKAFAMLVVSRTTA